MPLRRGLAGIVVALAVATVSHGQTAPEGLSFTTVDPPRSEVGARYRALARAETEATYATEIEGGRLTPESRPPRAPRPLPVYNPTFDGNLGLLLVVGILVLALLAWLRFGGGGLLTGAPAEARTSRRAAPDGWKLDADRDLGAEDLIASIAAMPDRRAAMVRLLRHCLLHAAAASGTRLARSDTERSALRRLPAPWTKGLLPELLRRTELANYGGQEVPEDRFAESLAAARMILSGGGAAHV